MSRRYCGSAFQSLGPTVDRVNGPHGRLCSRERRPLDGAYGTISSCKYAGPVLCTLVTTLNCMRRTTATGNQWSSFRTGVMWSFFSASAN